MAPPSKNIEGHIFGLLTAIRPTHKDKNRRTVWLCQCSCSDDKFKEVSISDLNSGIVKSCGCIKRFNSFKHGASRSKYKEGSDQLDYVIWSGIKHRCYNKNSKAYKYYGAKGVTLYSKWKNNFINFAAYIRELPNCPNNKLLKSRLKGKRLKVSIDRIDNKGNYEPGNIKWSNSKQQNENKTNAVMVKYRGKEVSLIEVTKEFSVVPHKIVYQRIFQNNWSLDKALKTPLGKGK